MNQVVITGRFKYFEDNKMIIVSNEKDIPINISEKLYEQTIDVLTPNAFVGIKGKIDTDYIGNVIIEAEKISFLSS